MKQQLQVHFSIIRTPQDEYIHAISNVDVETTPWLMRADQTGPA